MTYDCYSRLALDLSNVVKTYASIEILLEKYNTFARNLQKKCHG